jgi:C-terminal processing protease CtpA/Prc
VENHGVDPDIEVENMPAELLAGHDAQLETAVDLMQKAIAGKPTALPPPPPLLPPIRRAASCSPSSEDNEREKPRPRRGFVKRGLARVSRG